MPNIPRAVLIACLLLLAVPGQAQAPAAQAGAQPAAPVDPPGTTGAPADAGTAPAPAAPPDAKAEDPGTGFVPRDVADAAIRRLEAGGEEFGVQVLPLTGGQARGALVLVPGDGRYPLSSRAIADLQMGMRAFGWSTWLPELRSPPRIHSASLDARAATQEGAKETPAEQAEKPAATPAPASAEPAEPAAAASAPADAAPPPAQQVPGDAPALEADRALELQEWAAQSRARLAAVVAEAAGEGRVVLVAEGTAAALLTGLAADIPSAPFALALLDPVELPGLPAAWPKGTAIPVLEVFDQSTQRIQAPARRMQANAHGLHSYRQTVLTLDAPPTASEAESLLVRRLRGWLSTLDQKAAH